MDGDEMTASDETSGDMMNTTNADGGDPSGDAGGDGGDNTVADQGAGDAGADVPGDGDPGTGAPNGTAEYMTNSLAGGLGQIGDGMNEAVNSLVYAGADAFMSGGELLADGVGHVSAAFHGLIGDEQGVHNDLRNAEAFGRASAEREANVWRDLGLSDEPRREGFDIEREAGLQPPSWLR